MAWSVVSEYIAPAENYNSPDELYEEIKSLAGIDFSDILDTALLEGDLLSLDVQNEDRGSSYAIVVTTIWVDENARLSWHTSPEITDILTTLENTYTVTRTSEEI